MTESVIRRHGFTTGLYTSPHLITVRERIKLNGHAISESSFERYFWELWDRFQSHQVRACLLWAEGGPKPVSF